MISRIACVLCLAASCAVAASDDFSKSDLAITLERTECYRTCPAYKLTIQGDGSVVYEGKRFVRITGTQKSTISNKALSDLVDAFSAANYFAFEDSYISIHNADGSESMVTDLPTTYISFTLNGQTKRIVDYVGAPKELRQLEHKIEEVVGSKRWVSIDALSVHHEARLGWDMKSLQADKLFAEAAARGDAEVVRAFIEEGVNVNGRPGNLTPLQQAHGVEVVRLLVDAGADVNAYSNEFFGPPIGFAAHEGDTDSVKALLDAGAKIDARGRVGETALMEAADAGSPETVRFLLRTGANARLRTKSGEDALKYAGYGLERQEMLRKHPSLFQKQLPDFEQKYKEIRDLLTAAAGLTTK